MTINAVCIGVQIVTDLLFISPEIKEEVNDEFHQPLLYNYMTKGEQR